jgi:hypothetical protein
MYTKQASSNHFSLITIKFLWLMLTGRIVSTNNWPYLISSFARTVCKSNVFSRREKTRCEIFVAFDGEYTLFAGLEECLKFVRDYKFHTTDIDYLRTVFPDYVETEFFNYLATLNMNDVKIYAIPEGKNSF